MDRRAKKLEKKRKARDHAKKQATARTKKGPDERERSIRSAARGIFGPCFVSAGWNDTNSPALVSIVVTRELPNRLLLPVVALVDRTCLGVKDAFVAGPLHSFDVAAFADKVCRAHGAAVECAPLVAQSVVFHAIDFARKLGFEPHPDFPAALFEPRPAELLETPWCAVDRPIYIVGPHENSAKVMERLSATLGEGNFDYDDPMNLLSSYGEDDDDWLDDDNEPESADELLHSALERDVTRDGITVRIFIYKGARDPGWLLEVEDHLGGSTVWNETFTTEQAALGAAMQAIEEDGVASFTAPADQITGEPRKSNAL